MSLAVPDAAVLEVESVRWRQVRDAVGVEHDDVIRADDGLCGRGRMVVERAQEGPWFAERRGLAPCPDDDGQRMTSRAADQSVSTVRDGLEGGVAGRAEKVTARVQDRLVDPIEHGRVTLAVACRGANGVTHDAGHGGGVGAGTTDIADHDRPPIVGQREQIVEVTPDQGGFARGPVPHGDIDPCSVAEMKRCSSVIQMFSRASAMRPAAARASATSCKS